MQAYYKLITLATAAMFFSSSVPADNGVVEINQVLADAGGVTPGDDPGFPVTILTPGSYRLTSDLIVPGDTEGVFIFTGATLDLNGFSVIGPVTCTNTNDLGAEVVCNANGANGGSGIGIAAENVTIKNGTVRGFYFRGIGNSGHQGNILIDNVNVTQNGVGGFGCAGMSFDDSRSVVIRNSRAFKNGPCNGIELFDDSTIENSESAENKGSGVFFYAGGNTVRNSRIRANAQSGISYSGAFVAGANDNAVYDSVITDNAVHGIDNDQGTLYLRGNVINSNGALSIDDTFAGSGPVVDLGNNACGVTTSCP